MRTALERLVQVRAQLTDDLLAYLKKLKTELSENKLLAKAGRRLEGRLRVPLRVVPFEPPSDLAEIKAQESFRRDGNLLRDQDKFRRAYAQEMDEREERERAEREARRQRPRPLAELEPQLHHAVILGNPGSGKSEWLKYQAHGLAVRAWQQLHDGVALRDQMTVPVFLRLDAIAGWLAKDNRGELQTLMNRLPRCQTTTNLSGDALRGGAAILRELSWQGMSERLQLWLWERMRPRAQPAPKSGPPALVLYLDAWDEVRVGRDELGKCLRAFAEASLVRIFVTSRIIGYDPHHKPLPLPEQEDEKRRELRLCPFGWDEVRQFIEAFYPEDKAHAQQLCGELRAKPALNGTAQNPLLATLLCLAYAPGQAEKLELPLRRSELYERALKGLLGEWRSDKPEALQNELAQQVPEGWVEAKFALLAEIAGQIFPDQTVKPKELLDIIEDHLNDLPDARLLKKLTREEALKELCEDAVLVKAGGQRDPEYLFLHLTMQEYLAAIFYASKLKGPQKRQPQALRGMSPQSVQPFNREKLLAGNEYWQLIDRQAWNWVWHEVIIMLAGQLNDPQPLLELLRDKQEDDIYSHRLALAAETLPELTLEQQTRLQEQVNNITAGVFTRWFGAKLRHADAVLNHFPPTFPALAQARGRVSVSSVLAEFYGAEKSAASYSESRLLEQLGQLLANADGNVYWAAIAAVGELGSAAATPEFLARLGQLLADADSNVRWVAAEAVGKMGSAAATKEFLALLGPLLTDEDSDMRLAAVAAVGQLGSVAATTGFLALLGQLLADKNRDVSRVAVVAVGRLGSAAATTEFLAFLGPLLAHEDWYVREAAIEAVRGLGSAAATPEFLALLGQLLADKNWDVSLTAAKAVGELGSAAATPEILALLGPLLAHRYSTVREPAIAAVRELGSAAATPEIVALLGPLLAHEDSVVCEAAARALGGLGSAAATPEILALLGPLLAHEDWHMRQAAIAAVRGLGSAAATPEILALVGPLLADKNRDVSRVAVVAVGALGSAAATPEILALVGQLLTDEDSDMRQAAVAAARELGIAATPEIVALLGPRLAHEDWHMRQAAIEAVRGLGSAAATPEFLAHLESLLAHEDWHMRLTAAKAVGELGSAAATPEILALLGPLLADENWYECQAAVEAVRELGSAAATPEIVALLGPLLADKNRDGHWSVTEALAGFHAHGLRIFAPPADREQGQPALVAMTVDDLAAGKRPVFG